MNNNNSNNMNKDGMDRINPSNLVKPGSRSRSDPSANPAGNTVKANVSDIQDVVELLYRYIGDNSYDWEQGVVANKKELTHQGRIIGIGKTGVDAGVMTIYDVQITKRRGGDVK